MSKLTTHILDATHGKPANHVKIELFEVSQNNHRLILECSTNDDGRTDTPLLEGDNFKRGQYELRFHIGDYFRDLTKLPEIAFLDIVPIRFGIDDPNQHYHVPLLASPFSYSTYRGS